MSLSYNSIERPKKKKISLFGQISKLFEWISQIKDLSGQIKDSFKWINKSSEQIKDLFGQIKDSFVGISKLSNK